MAAAVMMSAFISGPATADSVDADVTWINNPSIIVESGFNKYTAVKGTSSSIEGEIRVDLDAETTGRVEGFFAWPVLGLPKDGSPSSNLSTQYFKDSGFSKSYSSPRPKKVTEFKVFSISRQDYEEFAVAVCNVHADNLRGQGKKNSEIFDQNRSVKINVAARVDAEMSGPDKINPVPQEVSVFRQLTIVCERDDSLDGPAAPDIVASYLKVDAVQNNAMLGSCELQISASIISKQPNTQVKFVYVDDKGSKSDLKTVTTGADSTVAFKHSYPISPGKRSGKIQLVGQSHAFTSNWWDFESDCSVAPQDIVTVLPPKAIALEIHATADKVMHRGLVCPAKVKIFGVMKGRGDVSGGAALFVGGKLNKLQQYDIEDGETIVVQGEYAFDWSETQLPQQSVDAVFNISNKTDLVDQMETSKAFQCVEVQVSGAGQGGPGGLATDRPKPQAAQQTAPVAGQLVLQPAPAIAIMAPKGRIRSGAIRLSGARANATYKLTFLRRSGGGYAAVSSARLPKQMKGANASFPLAALTGGRAWRLEVCPAGGPATACKTTDFRVPATANKAVVKTPDQPQGTTVIIIPGALK
ncbi:MAG: hypothetical protein RH951_07285 [Parvibaculum sp.]